VHFHWSIRQMRVTGRHHRTAPRHESGWYRHDAALFSFSEMDMVLIVSPP
jgi:hypothetical protein